MSKELTEQWRNGTLQNGWYYVKTPCGEIKKLYCGDGESLELKDSETAGYYFYHRDIDKGRVEVLAPVPSFPDLCELKQELEICKEEKADLYAKLCNALMQLEEANKVIKKYAYPKSVYKSIIENQEVLEVIAYTEPKEGLDYLEKWGVK